MAELNSMPSINIPKEDLLSWGQEWIGNINSITGKPKNRNAFDRQQSVNFASFIDLAFGKAIAEFLGNIPLDTAPKRDSLIPNIADSVEVGPVKIVGGVRPQNFDTVYRPDGPRIVFDSKTLNDIKSVGKNWQNMINDLGTEATTVHTRFPYALVVFAVIIPEPALAEKQQRDIIRTLERLSTRRSVIDLPHLAEAITLIVWNPETGTISENCPAPNSDLRYEKLSGIIEEIYQNRYKGLPPHDKS